jgi:hypothetical protein
MTDIRSIWESHTLTEEKQLKTKIDDVKNFRAYAATNHITGNHLFLLELNKEVPINNVKLTKFKGLSIDILDFGEYRELTIVLLDNKLKEIFTLFIENIIDELNKSITEAEALNNTANVIFLWKKLFDKINFSGLTLEQQKGLFGELLVIKELLSDGYPETELIHSWIGPQYEDKDYVFGSIGLEVKLTNSKYPSIKITNERQLDDTNLDSLFLLLYIVEEVKEKGISLVKLIDEIRNILRSNLEALKVFNDKLTLLGYNDEDATHYFTLYTVKQLNKYHVDEDFPKITQGITSPGIYNVGYRIELSACENHKVTNATIKELLNG